MRSTIGGSTPWLQLGKQWRVKRLQVRLQGMSEGFLSEGCELVIFHAVEASHRGGNSHAS